MEALIAPTLFGIVACVWLRIQQARDEKHWLNSYPRLLWTPTYIAIFFLWALGTAIIITLAPLFIGALVVYLIVKLAPQKPRP